MRGSIFLTFGVAVAILPSYTAYAEPEFDLILYGATGCVGHLAAEHLAAQPGLKWAIAARKLKDLQALRAQLNATGGPSSNPEIIVASLGAKDDMTWVKRSRAVATAAGPYSIHGGEFLLKACAENGVHYVDTSDEFYWQRRMVDAHDAEARRSGARVVMASGFCVLAGDIGSQLAIKSLAAKQGSSVHLDAWLEGYNGGLSAGVINTANAIKNASFPKEWNTDPYVLVPDAPAADRTDTLVEGMTYPSYVSGEGAVVANIFGPYDARLMRRSFAMRGQSVNLRVGATPGMYAKWLAFLAAHPGSWSKLATCPTKPILEGGSWSYRFKASADGVTKKILLSGSGDPGYHFTALGLAETGLCFAGKTAGCLRAAASGSSGGGVFTSMSAMDESVMQQRLESIGLLKVTSESDGESNALLI